MKKAKSGKEQRTIAEKKEWMQWELTRAVSRQVTMDVTQACDPMLGEYLRGECTWARLAQEIREQHLKRVSRLPWQQVREVLVLWMAEGAERGVRGALKALEIIRGEA